MAKSSMDIEEALRKLNEGKLKEYLEQNRWFPPHTLDTTNHISFLHYAAEQACFELVQVCVNLYAANINVKNGNQQTPLMWLLDRLASSKADDKNYQNYAKIALFLINHDNLDLNITDDANNNLIHFAASINDHQFLHALIEKFKNKKASLLERINAMNSVGRTPLHLTVRQNELSQHNIEILLMAGANPLLAEQSKNAVRPIDKIENLTDSPKKKIISKLLSATWPMREMLKTHNEANLELLQQLQLPDLSDETGCTPLFYAASYGQQAYVTLLCQRNCDVNKQDNNGWTPLHMAAIGGHDSVVQQLLSRGADFKLKNKQQRTALDEVKQCNIKQGKSPDKKLIAVQNLLQSYQHGKFAFFTKYRFELLLALSVILFLAAMALLLFPTFAPVAVTQFAVSVGFTKLQAFLALTASVLIGAVIIESIKLLSGNGKTRSADEEQFNLDSQQPLLKNNGTANGFNQQHTHSCFSSFLFPSKRGGPSHKIVKDKSEAQRLVP